MPELVIPGVNGFLVESTDEAVAATRSARGLDRANIRASAEEHFDVSRMVDEYLALYHRLTDAG